MVMATGEQQYDVIKKGYGQPGGLEGYFQLKERQEREGLSEGGKVGGGRREKEGMRNKTPTGAL